MTEPRIRDATMEDAEALLAIYRPFVANTFVSFEVEAPSVAEFRQRSRAAGRSAMRTARPTGRGARTSGPSRRPCTSTTGTGAWASGSACTPG